MKIRIDFECTVTEAKPETIAEIRNRLTFDNPAYLENVKRGFSTWNTPRLIECWKCNDGILTFPRGFTGQACRIAKKNGEQLLIEDARRTLPSVNFSFLGSLKPFQSFGVNDVLKKDFGVLEAATGAGKTIMALKIIEARSQPALIICHTTELLNQWRERVAAFTDVPRDEIGIIGGGKMRIGAKITVALVQSLCKCAADAFEHVGFLIVDECHRCPSKTFLDVVTAFDCKYMLGLSATPFRRDKLTRLIYYYLGDEVHRVDGEQLIENGDICRSVVETVETQFQTALDASTQYSKMLSQLCEDVNRNQLVASFAAGEASVSNGVSLLLSDRKSHCTALQAVLSSRGIMSDVLTGDTTVKERKSLSDKLKAGNVRILIATGQLIGEGFDLPEISSVILGTPLKFSGRLIQYVGRSLRPSPGKDYAKIVDFCDSNVGVLANGAKSRARTFSRMAGVTII